MRTKKGEPVEKVVVGWAVVQNEPKTLRNRVLNP